MKGCEANRKATELNDADAFPLDSLGMGEAVATIPDQLRAGITAGAQLVPGAASIRAVLVAGDGVAAHAAAMVAAVTSGSLSVPMQAMTSATVPRFVGEGTLVFAVSASGYDQRAIAAARQAVSRGATVVAVTSGGALGDFARSADVAVMAVPTVPRSRAAVCAMVADLLAALVTFGVLPDVSAMLEAAANQARARLWMPVAYDTLFHHLAQRIGRTFPFVIGGSGIGAVVANWWRSEIAANARTPSFSASVPELFDDEIAAFGQGGDITRQIITLVMLRSDHEPAGADSGFERLDELLAEVVAEVVTYSAAGDGALAQLIDLVVVGELVSLELAQAGGVDPGPAPAIDEAPGGSTESGGSVTASH